MSKEKSAVSGVVVTKSDTTTFYPTRGLWIETAGDVRVLLAEDAAPITLPNMQAGFPIPISVTKVYDTGTAAVGTIVALY